MNFVNFDDIYFLKVLIVISNLVVVILDYYNENILVMCFNGLVSIFFGMVSIRCILGICDVLILVGLYRFLIVCCVWGIELFFYLKDVIDECMCILWLLLIIFKKINIYKFNIFMIYYCI